MLLIQGLFSELTHWLISDNINDHIIHSRLDLVFYFDLPTKHRSSEELPLYVVNIVLNLNLILYSLLSLLNMKLHIFTNMWHTFTLLHNMCYCVLFSQEQQGEVAITANLGDSPCKIELSSVVPPSGLVSIQNFSHEISNMPKIMSFFFWKLFKQLWNFPS